MKKSLFVCAAGVAALLAGYGFAQSGTGRVIARVGDEKITLADLQAEVSPNAPPAVQKAALQAMVNRKLLAQQAVQEKLDKSPIGAMVVKRAEEGATVSLLEQKLAGSPPNITDDQVRAYIAGHPLMFSGRRLLTLNQFITEEGGQALTHKLEPANSMEDFQHILLQNSVSYRRSAGVADTLKLDPKIATQLLKMKPGDVFISPRGSGLELSGVIGNDPAPITGAQADALARTLLARGAVANHLGGEISKIVKAGQADVKINADYEPKKK